MYSYSTRACIPIAYAHPLMHMVDFRRGAPVGAPSMSPYKPGDHPISQTTLRVH